MKKVITIPHLYFLIIVTALLPLQINAGTVLQAFKGSTEKGIYKSDFVEFEYAGPGNKKPEIKTVEWLLPYL